MSKELTQWPMDLIEGDDIVLDDQQRECNIVELILCYVIYSALMCSGLFLVIYPPPVFSLYIVMFLCIVSND